MADDYRMILSRALAKAEEMVGVILSEQAQLSAPLTTCRLLNETICIPAQSLKVGEALG